MLWFLNGRNLRGDRLLLYIINGILFSSEDIVMFFEMVHTPSLLYGDLMVVEKVGLQELGPRFTMKLLWIKRGIAGSGEESKILEDGKKEGDGEVEWSYHPSLETSKRKFFL